MILVIPDHICADDIAKALIAGGFKIRPKPGGIFELVPAPHRRPVCESPDCQDPASIVTRGTGRCARHALSTQEESKHERVEI